MLAIKDLGEAVRPLGLKCFSDEECKQNLSEDVIVELFRKAVQIQKEHMIQSLATVTLLYMPSYEVLGYVLLLTATKPLWRCLRRASRRGWAGHCPCWGWRGHTA